jgi:hypothetical protein
MKTSEKAALVLLSILTASALSAQENISNKILPLQVTFAYPIGSNGINSMDYTNRFSLNILYGLNGGVSGVEIGSIVNFIKENATGIQISGVANFNGGETDGVQIAGVLNINNTTNGIQIAGVSNINRAGTMGLQIATTNFAAGDFTGIQIGVVNFSKSLTGLQLGVVNIAENAEKGIPVGIINIVKNGHYELEVTGGETIYLNVNFKMGVEKFYTLFKAGIGSFKKRPVYSTGIGFGGMLRFNDKNILSIDATTNQIIYNNEWTSEKLDMLNKLDLNYKFALLPKFTILIGPSMNIYVTERIIDGKYGSLDIPYHIYSNETSDIKNKTYIWIGVNAGLALKF